MIRGEIVCREKGLRCADGRTIRSHGVFPKQVGFARGGDTSRRHPVGKNKGALFGIKERLEKTGQV